MEGFRRKKHVCSKTDTNGGKLEKNDFQQKHLRKKNLTFKTLLI
jgi:hypothetical protein